ncbi:MAG: hypothetical protein QOF20_2258 [Acidimicrobiaceae bacterium]|jgi:hypothetical protein|nr:hypothetical protein [Acidimicrobiaceae bacterium]MDQ1364662.1 hypothetical protein [Acidimicrobiaceae bacterium]MDQ1369905.1 hypothetical protein [Acidimicrobiaceae bacterium]MDQ1399603.1 hypothetical protein [Acidimicrobiaceae bacterium]MDQ1413323.1 hypothetical protein [Acidimicrobiaceae bacterium]
MGWVNGMSEQVDLASIGRQGRRLDDWVVIIEATTDRATDSFDFTAVQDLLGRLREWHASGLYNPQRYAIQLHIAAVAPYDALRCAVAYHDLASRAVGLTKSSLTRAEVLTLGEFEMGLLLPAAPPGTPSPRGRHSLISQELYTTTRALLRVSTPGEITALLVAFVTSVGGSVNVGECRPVPGMITVALSTGAEEQLHAVAESMSVAGMIIEQSLPTLVEDARLALRQLHEASN